MKRLILFILLPISLHFAQENSLTPSYYFTYGKYSNGSESYSNAGYATYYINSYDYLVASYENLKINNDVWNYRQQMFTIGGMKNFYPFYLKFNYSNIQGKFSAPGLNGIYNYTDKINVFNPEIIWNYALSFVGISYTYLNLNSVNKPVKSSAYGLYLGAYLTDKFFFSLRPYYNTLSDSRKLWSVRIKLTWLANSKIDVSFASSIGQRAYFYDPEYLTIFNQDETQNGWYELRVRYAIADKINLRGYYQYTDFTDYKISYIGIGASYKIIFK